MTIITCTSPHSPENRSNLAGVKAPVCLAFIVSISFKLLLFCKSISILTLDIMWILSAVELVAAVELLCLTNTVMVTTLEMCWSCHYPLSTHKPCMKSSSVLLSELSWIHVAPVSALRVCARVSVGFTVKLSKCTPVHTLAQSNTNPY